MYDQLKCIIISGNGVQCNINEGACITNSNELFHIMKAVYYEL